MLWEDALVECHLADDTLAEAVASVFAIDPKAVLIVNAVEDCVGWDDGDVLVLVERRLLEGAFKLHLSVSLRHPGLERGVESRQATLATLQRLAARLDCALIVSDESLDPSAWLLIRGSGAIEAVTLDVERLDEGGFVSLLARGGDRQAPAEIGA